MARQDWSITTIKRVYRIGIDGLHLQIKNINYIGNNFLGPLAGVGHVITCPRNHIQERTMSSPSPTNDVITPGQHVF
jgi:hypothetical protein